MLNRVSRYNKYSVLLIKVILFSSLSLAPMVSVVREGLIKYHPVSYPISLVYYNSTYCYFKLKIRQSSIPDDKSMFYLGWNSLIKAEKSLSLASLNEIIRIIGTLYMYAMMYKCSASA